MHHHLQTECTDKAFSDTYILLLHQQTVIEKKDIKTPNRKIRFICLLIKILLSL